MSGIVTKLDNTEEPLLKLEDLSIDYRIRNGYLSAVSDVNFTMNRGEIVALVGESGCGKSTIAFTIMRLLMDGNEKIGGKILFKGEDLNKIPVREMEKMRGKHIGMIFQNPLDSLNPVYRFANRCPLAKEICSTENPPVLTVSHDHTFSCHFAEEASKL